MNNVFRVSGAILFIFLLLIPSCKKEIKPTPPIITTTAIIEISHITATVEGDVTNDGGAPIISRGICWNTSDAVTIANNKTKESGGLGTFTSTINEQLVVSTMYWVKAYATNSVGTGYGNAISFRTKFSPIIFNPNLTYGTVTDIEGHQYKTITIGKSKTMTAGTQVWMAENLKTTKYNDETDIPLVTNYSEWAGLSTHAYCWSLNNEELYKNLYGAIYNGYAATTGKLCPIGWHVPTDDEWTTLIEYLGGSNVAGDKLKESGTTHWSDPNTGATNEIGFTALPGGNRDSWSGGFSSIGFISYWWSSSESGTNNVWGQRIEFEYNRIDRVDPDKKYGCFVRCIKDN